MSLFTDLVGGLFGKKKSGGDTMPAQVLLPEWQQAAGKQLSDYVTQYLKNYQPGKAYSGDFTADLTGAENTGLAQLNQFLSAPNTGELFKSANQNILDTVSGKFSDPAASPFIQAMTNLSKMNLQDSIDASRRSAGSRGTYFTKSAIEGENRLRERANTGLDAVIGDFINQERGRQQTANSQALAFDKYANFDAPLSKVTASQTLGSLPRLLEQADLEAQYADFQRQQNELSGVPSTAQSLFNSSTPYIPSYTTPVVQKNNTLGNIMDIIGNNEDKILSLIGGGQQGGGAGAGGWQGLLQMLSKVVFA